MTTGIHLIEKNDFISHAKDSTDANIYESGWWKISKVSAEKLIGGNIYFHKSQSEPSFFGGQILSYRIESIGKYRGRIVFRFRSDFKYQNIKSETGWAMEKKYDWC